MGTVAEGVDSIRDPGIGAPAADAADGAARPSQDGPVAATPRRADDPRMLRAALVVGDLVVVAGAWALGGYLAGAMTPRQRMVGAVLAALATMAGLARGGTYRARLCARASAMVPRLLVPCALGGAVFAGYQWGTTATDWDAPAAGAVVAAVGLLLARWRFDRRLRARRAAGRALRPVLLVGSGDDAARLTRMLVEEPELGYRVVGAVGTAAPDPLGCTLARVEDVAELPALARRTGASGVLIAGNATTVDGCNVVELAIGSGLHVQVWPGLGALSHRRVRLAPVARMPVLYVEPNPVARWQLVTKRVVDVVVAVALLPVVAPVLLVAALWIKLEDGGPIFHHHEVIGRFGAPMTVLKLRTMVPNAAEMLVDIAGLNERTGGPLFKATHDPRVTRAGRVLRATSIDELPQLFNVLAGSMSLIGPRFALPNEEAQFDEEHRRRHGMRPGITGLWQSEARDNPSFSAYRRLDLFYVDNWTLALDLAIAANTAHAVATRALRALGGRRHGSVSRPSPALGPDRAGDLP